MPINNERYSQVRAHFRKLLGGDCCLCGSVFNLEFHHPIPLNTSKGRGRDVRMWEWFNAYSEGNLSLLCRSCHKKYHKGDINND